MVSARSSVPNWVHNPPAAFDIVACFFPETKPKAGLRLRPCLILNLFKGKSSGKYLCRVAYGTTNLKTTQRRHKDLIIQNMSDLDELGLPVATRFNLDKQNIVDLPWTPKFFGCWSGKKHPFIGKLTEHYEREYAWLMMLRHGK